MKKSLLLVAAFAIFGSWTLVETTRGQSGNPQPAVRRPSSSAGDALGSSPAATDGGYGGESTSGQTGGGAGAMAGEAHPSIDQLMNQLRESDDDAKRTALIELLTQAVDQDFDVDLTAREVELNRVEERLKLLRVQLERRRKAKAEIIELQIKVMVNEADGLGFTARGQGQPSKRVISSGSPLRISGPPVRGYQPGSVYPGGPYSDPGTTPQKPTNPAATNR